MNREELVKYGKELHERFPGRKVEKSSLRPKLTKIKGIKAVTVDIYGNLLTSNSNQLKEQEERAYKKTVEEFGLESKWNKLKQIFDEQVEKEHKKKKTKKIEFPEILTEKVWKKVLEKIGAPDLNELKVAYFFDAAKTRSPYPNSFETLKNLKDRGIKVGIASNSQFYTKIDLDFFLGKSSNGKIRRWQDFFEPELNSFSFELGFSKPNKKFFEKQLKKFKAKEIVQVGNDIVKDIWAAQSLGIKTVLFAGDKKSLRLEKKELEVEPDAIITDWKQLLEVIE